MAKRASNRCTDCACWDSCEYEIPNAYCSLSTFDFKSTFIGTEKTIYSSALEPGFA
jgi:hypothetical protein